MEIRKLQLIGGSSYMVSLPKSWIDLNSLKKGDELILNVDSNHIFIRPKKCSSILKGYIRIGSCDSGFLKHLMHSLYIQGFDEVTVEGKITPELTTKISDVARGLIGMEIIDAKSDRVTLKFIVDAELVEVLNRMSQIVSTMLQLLESGIKERKTKDLLDVAKLERDADRLYMLAVRQENRLMKELSCPSKWSDLKFVLGARVVVKHLEDLADILYNFAFKASVSPPGFSEFVPLLKELKIVFEKAFSAYMEGDAELAEEVITSAEHLQKMSSGELFCASRQIKSIGEVAFNKAVRESGSEGL